MRSQKWILVILFISTLAWAEDIDQEIIKNFEFFYHMEVVEDLDTLDQDQDLDSESQEGSRNEKREDSHASL